MAVVIDDVDSVSRAAFEIWDGFVSPSAQLQVNLSGTNFQPLKSFFSSAFDTAGGSGGHFTMDAFVSWCHLQTPSTLYGQLFPLFDAAQREIFALMETDSFKRFLRSAVFEEMCDEFKRNPSSVSQMLMSPSNRAASSGPHSVGSAAGSAAGFNGGSRG